MLTLGSLFDGIGGWLLAAKRNDVQPKWACEIDDFATAVSKHHYPSIVRYGDVTKINGADLEPVDIICASTPGQDFSVSGERFGMMVQRGRLFFEAMRIVEEMRKKTNGLYPRYFVLETVQGLFSSNKGMDFGAVLSKFTETKVPVPQGGKWAQAGMVEWGECSLAWRVLDSKYFGLPQSRPKLFLVADFAGNSAGEVLFESESLQGNPAPRRTAKEDAASRFKNRCRENSSSINTYQNVIGSLCVDDHKGINNQYVSQNKCIVAGGRPRRLTPLECERLQGLPDNWTNFIYQSKPVSDTQRYKVIGDSVAQPCAEYVLRLIVLGCEKSVQDSKKAIA